VVVAAAALKLRWWLVAGGYMGEEKRSGWRRKNNVGLCLVCG